MVQLLIFLCYIHALSSEVQLSYDQGFFSLGFFFLLLLINKSWAGIISDLISLLNPWNSGLID